MGGTRSRLLEVGVLLAFRNRLSHASNRLILGCNDDLAAKNKLPTLEELRVQATIQSRQKLLPIPKGKFRDGSQ
jgi:hypothetical protein